ncbi:MAG: DNA primase, partial [Nannocystaceae bacterium]
DEKLQELRDKIDIVDLIGRHVGLRRSGRNYKACCPFHGEKTPSFFVNPERRSFKCFGCGEYGDGLEFVMKVEGLSFPEAAHKLAGLYGVQLPTRGGLRPEQQADRQAGMEILRVATQFYRELLVASPAAESAREYQRKRGVSDEIAQAFGLGYAPAPTELGWDPLARALTKQGLPLELAKRLGLVVHSDRTGTPFDRFRGRWMFPIVLPGGTVVGFSGRILPEFETESDGQKSPKYVNSPESDLYKKSKCLFGLQLAGQEMRKRRRAILVEGNVDVVAMHQRGFSETVAPLGTSLTTTQAQVISRFTDKVVLCFDGDRAGLKAAEAAIPVLLEAGLDTRMVVLGEGEDPDSADPERLANLLERPPSALEWYLHRLVRQGATESIDAQARALSSVAPLLRKIKREAARDLYIDRAAKLLNLSPSRISAVVRGQSGRGGSAGGYGAPPDRYSRQSPDRFSRKSPDRFSKSSSSRFSNSKQSNNSKKRFPPRGNERSNRGSSRGADRFSGPPPGHFPGPPADFPPGPPENFHPGPPADFPPGPPDHFSPGP